jgi:hypothetical protein
VLDPCDKYVESTFLFEMRKKADELTGLQYCQSKVEREGLGQPTPPKGKLKKVLTTIE